MDRLTFIRKMMRSGMMILFTMTAGFLFFKNTRKDENCPESRSLSNCKNCRLNSGCDKSTAVDWRSNNNMVREKMGNKGNEF